MQAMRREQHRARRLARPERPELGGIRDGHIRLGERFGDRAEQAVLGADQDLTGPQPERRRDEAAEHRIVAKPAGIAADQRHRCLCVVHLIEAGRRPQNGGAIGKIVFSRMFPGVSPPSFVTDSAVADRPSGATRNMPATACTRAAAWKYPCNSAPTAPVCCETGSRAVEPGASLSRPLCEATRSPRSATRASSFDRSGVRARNLGRARLS